MPNRIVLYFFMGNIEVTIIRNFNHGLNRRSRELTIKVHVLIAALWSVRVTRIRTFLKPQFVFSWFVRVDRALNHSGELVRTQFLGSVTGHFEPFTVWSSQLTGMESSVPSWVLTKVFCVMLYSVMHFCVFAFRVMPFWWWPFPCFFPLPWLLALTRYIFLDLTYPLPLSG